MQFSSVGASTRQQDKKMESISWIVFGLQSMFKGDSFSEDFSSLAHSVVFCWDYIVELYRRPPLLSPQEPSQLAYYELRV